MALGLADFLLVCSFDHMLDQKQVFQKFLAFVHLKLVTQQMAFAKAQGLFFVTAISPNVAMGDH